MAHASGQSQKRFKDNNHSSAMSGENVNNPELDMERVLVRECRITPEMVAFVTGANKPISNQQTMR